MSHADFFSLFFFLSYDYTGRVSRTEYAMDIFGMAKDLDRPFEDKEVVKCLSSYHYGRDERAAIRSQGIRTREALLELLDEYDYDPTANRAKQNTQGQNTQTGTSRTYTGNQEDRGTSNQDNAA